MTFVERLLIFLASPGDVPSERNHVEMVVQELNRSVATDRGVTLQVVRWERDTFPGYGKDPQALVNEQIAAMSRYALFIGVMWGRVGTPTPRAESGTIEEYERAAQAHRRTGHPDIWFYFRRTSVKAATPTQAAQRDRVAAFRRQLGKKALYWDYDTPSKFRDLLRAHLTQWLLKRPQQSRASTTTSRNAGQSAPRSLTAVTAPAHSPARSLRGGKGKPGSGKITDSRSLVMIGEGFYPSTQVSHRSDGSVEVHIRLIGAGGEMAADLRALKPDTFRRPIVTPFAHQNEAGQMRVKSVEWHAAGARTEYVVSLDPENGPVHGGAMDMGINQLTANDVATLRARLILLDEVPASDQDHGFIRSIVSSIAGANQRINPGSLPNLWRRLGMPTREFLPRARLLSVYLLKVSGVTDDILELSLGPVQRGRLHVHFRGRRSRYGEQHAVEVKGICNLTTDVSTDPSQGRYRQSRGR